VKAYRRTIQKPPSKLLEYEFLSLGKFSLGLINTNILLGLDVDGCSCPAEMVLNFSPHDVTEKIHINAVNLY